MAMQENKRLPTPTIGQWRGVPMNTVRLATIMANRRRMK